MNYLTFWGGISSKPAKVSGLFRLRLVAVPGHFAREGGPLRQTGNTGQNQLTGP